MVQIVRRNDGLDEGEAAVEFNVYRSLRDQAIIYGYMRYVRDYSDVGRGFSCSSYGVPMAEAFRSACLRAQQHGIPTLVVIDPGNLCPMAD